jgi:uncharacterized protein (UPF0248 family)
MNDLRDLLNRLRWDPGEETGGAEILVLVRRAGESQIESVPFDHLAEITSAGVVVADGTFLPFHRIQQVRRRGDVLWRRSVPPKAAGDPP